MIERVYVGPPPLQADFRSCAEEPEPPDGARVTQGQVAVYLLELARAGRDCRQRLGAVVRLWDRARVAGQDRLPGSEAP